jgi:aconitase B
MDCNKQKMMKRILLGMTFIGSCMTASAQFGATTNEMLEQLAALQAYITVAEKGYTIAEQGLQAIGQIKNGEFTLHSAFVSSLKAVSPAVGNMAEVAEIIGLEASMISQFSHKLNGWQQSAWLQPAEVSYINQVYTTVVNNGQELITALLNLTTDGQLTMTDGERINRIQQMDADMQRQYRMVQMFTNQTDLLAVQRQQEGNDISTLKGIYGIQ